MRFMQPRAVQAAKSLSKRGSVS